MPFWGKKCSSILERLKDQIELLGTKQPNYLQEHVCWSRGGAEDASFWGNRERKWKRAPEQSSESLFEKMYSQPLGLLALIFLQHVLSRSQYSVYSQAKLWVWLLREEKNHKELVPSRRKRETLYPEDKLQAHLSSSPTVIQSKILSKNEHAWIVKETQTQRWQQRGKNH